MKSHSRRSFLRLWRIRSVIKQHGLSELLDEFELTGSAKFFARLALGGKQQTSEPRAVRIRRAFESLGPVFIKLGQALSTRPDLLPADIASELTKLQDEVPPFSGEEALRIIRQQYGEELDKIFAHIDPEPLASASVAQVHAAELQPGLALPGKNGQSSEQVVIKVLRPNVEAVIEKDLTLMYTAAKFLDNYWARSAQFKPLQIIKEYENTIRGELDLRLEAANGSQMGANFAHTDIIYVPIIYWDYTQANVMVMERIQGTSVRDVAELERLGYDLEQLASDGVTTFFKQAFEDNFFHADMHPGNIFVSEQGKWIAIDFGIMGVLEEEDKRYLAEMLLGFFNRDYRAIAESHLRAGWIPANTSVGEFETAVRMVCEPNFAKPIAEISFGKVLMELFQTVQRFEMPVQPQLVLLYKTLLQIEGLGRQLYPQLNLWDTAKPFLENWMKQQLSPQALFDDFKKDWPRWRAILAELPDHLDRLQQQSRTANAQHVLSAQAGDKNSNSHQAKAQQKIGFTVSVLSLLALLGQHFAIVDLNDWNALLLGVAMAGIAWAFYHTR